MKLILLATLLPFALGGCGAEEEVAPEDPLTAWEVPSPIGLALNPKVLPMLEELVKSCAASAPTDKAATKVEKSPTATRTKGEVNAAGVCECSCPVPGPAAKPGEPDESPSEDDAEEVAAVEPAATPLLEEYRCRPSLGRDFVGWSQTQKATDILATLANLAAGSQSREKAASALRVIPGVFASLDAAGRKGVATEATAVSLMWALREHQGSDAVGVASVATHVLGMLKRKDALAMLVEKHPSDEVRQVIFENAMSYGDMEFFEIVRLGALRDDGKYTVAALRGLERTSALRSAGRDRLCPWAQSFLHADDPEVSTQSARVLVACEGDYALSLVDEGRRRLRNAGLTSEFIDVFGDLCVLPGPDVSPAVRRRCKATHGFLTKVLKAKSVPAQVRARALRGIYRQRRDKRTLRMMRKYRDHPVPEVRAQAKLATSELMLTYGLR